MDKGPWGACLSSKGAYVQSGDFEHDVRLYVTGNFEGPVHAFDYAKWLALELNKKRPTNNGGPNET